MIPEAREVRLRPKIRKVLEARCRAPSTPQSTVKRARIVLLAAQGRSTRSIAIEVGVQPRIVSKWRHRFADHGLAGLNDLPRAAKKPIYGQATNKRILALLDKPPPDGYGRWTGPLLANALEDVDVQYVWRFLREHNIDLAVRKSWCESNDPEFAPKAADVVGLYIDPPAKAVVICVDEKPSIQALERAQGYLKLPNGRALTGQSHDYKRHGTTPLFAGGALRDHDVDERGAAEVHRLVEGAAQVLRILDKEALAAEGLHYPVIAGAVNQCVGLQVEHRAFRDLRHAGADAAIVSDDA